MLPLAVAAAVAERQHLIIAPWQLRLAGASEWAVATRIRAQGWRRCDRGTIWLPGPDEPVRRLAASLLAYARPVEAESRFRRLSARHDAVSALVGAALQAGQVACGPSAAWLHGLAGPPPVDWLRVPGHSGHLRRADVCLRYGSVPLAHVRWLRGLPVCDVERTLMDMAWALRKQRRRHVELARMIGTADALRLTTLDTLEARMDAAGAFHGATLLARVVTDLRGGLSHSRTEGRARGIVGEVLSLHGLALHPRPYTVSLAGRPAGEADLAVVELRYDIEIDGPHHLLPAQQRADQRRDRLMQRAGWQVDRYPVGQVDDAPHAFAREVDGTVRALLARRQSGLF